MNKLLVSVSALAVTVFVSQAYAANGERWPRWYLGLSGGVAFLDESDIGGAATGNVDYNTGGFGTVSLGYNPAFSNRYLNNLRMEAELGYHYNGLDSLSLGGAGVPASGHIAAFSYMGNLYYDFRSASAWTPYVGAGAGGARIHLSKTSGLGNSSSNDTVFAYQAMAGLSYAPKTLPQTEWSLGYRYFATQDPKFNAAGGGSVELDGYDSHNVEVGAKFRF